jgi:hypothetical protein
MCKHACVPLHVYTHDVGAAAHSLSVCLGVELSIAILIYVLNTLIYVLNTLIYVLNTLIYVLNTLIYVLNTLIYVLNTLIYVLNTILWSYSGGEHQRLAGDGAKARNSSRGAATGHHCCWDGH